MDSSEANKLTEEAKPAEAAEAASQSSVPRTALASVEGNHTPSDNAEATVAEADSSTNAEKKKAKKQKKPGHNKPRYLYQALARIEGSLKTVADDLVLVTKGDKTELVVTKVAGPYTAVHLLKRPANRRQGIYSLYPLEKGYKVINYRSEQESKLDTNVPPNGQMFICGKLAAQEDGAFLVDIGRHKRTHKAKRHVEIPLRVEGQEADPTWKVGQWVSLALHREGQKWVWKGEKRAVLRGTLPFKDKEGKIGGA